jgi:hypothetical protein
MSAAKGALVRHLVTALTACVLSASAGTAHAQRAVSLVVAGGVSLPVGNFAEGVGTGWHAGAGLLLSSPMQPISLRVDATRHQFEFDAATGNQAIISGTLNLLYRLPSAGKPLAPYLSGGAGAYHASCGGDATCDSATHFGWNVGAGSRMVIVGLRTFIEARYHTVVQSGTNARFIPITVGIIL